MSPEQASAEKELLKIIENPSKDSKKTETAKKEFSKGLKVRKAQVEAKSASPRISFKEILKDRKLSIRLLTIGFCFAVLFFVVTFAKEYLKMRNMKNIGQVSAGVLAASETSEGVIVKKASAEDDSDQEKPLNVLQQIERNIFRPGPPPKKIEAEVVDPTMVVLQDYRLAGLSPAANPEESYAIVENTKAKTTSFIKSGEVINGAVLTTITDDKAIFKMNGKEIELR
ncbi:MAG: hypothetical protein WCG06_02460 [Candidatus Omnitrophota bacterium]